MEKELYVRIAKTLNPDKKGLSDDEYLELFLDKLDAINAIIIALTYNSQWKKEVVREMCIKYYESASDSQKRDADVVLLNSIIMYDTAWRILPTMTMIMATFGRFCNKRRGVNYSSSFITYYFLR